MDRQIWPINQGTIITMGTFNVFWFKKMACVLQCRSDVLTTLTPKGWRFSVICMLHSAQETKPVGNGNSIRRHITLRTLFVSFWPNARLLYYVSLATLLDGTLWFSAVIQVEKNLPDLLKKNIWRQSQGNCQWLMFSVW